MTTDADDDGGGRGIATFDAGADVVVAVAPSDVSFDDFAVGCTVMTSLGCKNKKDGI